MGGDHAPAVVVEGALAAARHLDVRVLLVGPEAQVTSVLRPLAGGYTGALEVVDAEETVSNDEPAALALRRRPRAAIRVAAELVAARRRRRARQRRPHRRHRRVGAQPPSA